MTFPSGRDYSRRASTTCPVGGCTHAIFWHDVDEIPWPRIERCTVTDCGCSGLVESTPHPHPCLTYGATS